MSDRNLAALAVRRYVTPEHLTIYRQLYDALVGKEISFKEAVNKVLALEGARNRYSSAYSVFGELNKKFKEYSDEVLVKRLESGEWTSTESGKILYDYAARIDRSFNELFGKLAPEDSTPNVLVAINSHSFRSFSDIEKRAHKKSREYKTHFENVRSSEIPSILLKQPAIDFAVGDSLINKHISNYDNLEYATLDEKSFFLITNYEVDDAFLFSEETYSSVDFRLNKNFDIDLVDRSILENITLISGRQGIILDYFLSVLGKHDGHGKFSPEAKLNELRNKLKIITTADTVNLLIDMLLLDSRNLAMVGTGTIFGYAKNRAKLFKLSDDLPENRKVRRYKIKGDKLKIHRRIFRRADDENVYGESHPLSVIWKIAKEIERELDTKIKKA